MELNFLNSTKELFGKFTLSLSDEERKKAISYLYIILTLLTVSFFGFFAIAPTLATISNLNKQFEDNKLVYDALNKKLSNLQLLDFQYREVQPSLETIYSAIPRTTKIPYLARQLENIASENSVAITKLSFNTVEVFPNTKKDPIYSFAFTISVVGNQSNINNFIGSLINFDRIIGIDRVITGKDEENKYTASVTGRGYFSNK